MFNFLGKIFGTSNDRKLKKMQKFNHSDFFVINCDVIFDTDFYDTKLNRVKTVPYKRNTFVMFANNSPNTVHGVSLRENAKLHRRSVNIIGEFKRGYATMYNVQEIK